MTRKKAEKSKRPSFLVGDVVSWDLESGKPVLGVVAAVEVAGMSYIVRLLGDRYPRYTQHALLRQRDQPKFKACDKVRTYAKNDGTPARYGIVLKFDVERSTAYGPDSMLYYYLVWLDLPGCTQGEVVLLSERELRLHDEGE